MSFIGNLLWIVLGGGLVVFLEYVISGIALCVTVVGIPFGFQCFKLAFLGLVPFGKQVRPREPESGTLALVFNIIWLLIGGIWIALTHLLFAAVMAVTIIGLPFAVQHLKLTRLALTPFGTEIR